MSDCGRLVNQMVVEGQIVGGVIHGIGNALLERMVYDENAQPMTTNFSEYLLPSATGLPPIEVLHHISPSPLNPLGVKGVGECGVIPAAAAIISGNRGVRSSRSTCISRRRLFFRRGSCNCVRQECSSPRRSWARWTLAEGHSMFRCGSRGIASRRW